MYVFHSSGMGVSVATDRRVTQSHSVSRLSRSVRRCFQGFSSRKRWISVSISIFVGFFISSDNHWRVS